MPKNLQTNSTEGVKNAQILRTSYMEAPNAAEGSLPREHFWVVGRWHFRGW